MLLIPSRTANTLASLDVANASSEAPLRRFADEGASLRLALRDQQPRSNESFHRSSEAQQCFQNIQNAAISIYLSGIFDYHEGIWTQHGIAVPKLRAAEIDFHVTTILDQVERSLSLSELSGISYVFALRVAGARSWSFDQQERVRALLTRIERCYVCANALIVDLLRLWTSRSPIQGQDTMTLETA